MIELDNKKKMLEVYYYIDLEDNSQDIEVLEKCLQVFLTVNNRDYIINKFVNCDFIKNNTNDKTTNTNDKTTNINDKNKQDVIKKGLVTFNNMVNNLKLKTSNEIWMFYISKGNINKIHEDVFVILLNKEPIYKRSYYVINKLPININKQLDKDKKLENLKLFNKNLQELFNSEKIITYTNLNE